MEKFMGKIVPFIIFMLLSACATGSWQHRSGQNSSASYDQSSCESYAAAKVPIYICRNPLMCVGDEIGRVWGDIARRDSTFQHCMHQKGYQYVEEQ